MLSIFWPVKLLFWLLGTLISLLVFASFALTAASFFGDKGFWWDLWAHFRMQYLVIQAVGLLASFVTLKLRKKPKAEVLLTFIVFAFFIGLNLSQIAPYYLASKPKHISTPPLKLMHFNVFGKVNPHVDWVAQAIRAENPDIVDLVEYPEGYQQKLEATGVFKAYPYRMAGRAHVALYSKIPFNQKRLFFVPHTTPVANTANLLVHFKRGPRTFNLLVAHPISPFLPERLQEQQQFFQMWIRDRKQYGENLLLVGDLNTTPWSPEFQQLLKKTDLRDSQLGFGIQPSWPAFFPISTFFPHYKNQMTHQVDFTRFLAIPIDHVLISPQLQILSRKTGPFVGSDHLPVIVVFGVR